jgi:hypothetical protein
MKNGAFRKATDGSQLSRRSLNQMLLGGSVGLVALTESAAAASKTAGAATNEVEDRLAIRDLIYRCAMALDSLDRDALVDCMAPDARDLKALEWGIDYHRKYEHTMHNILNHLCTVRERMATSVTYAIASMIKRGVSGLEKFDIYFCYHDELAKYDQRWFISKRELTVLFSSKASTVEAGAPLLELSVPAGSLRTPPVLKHLWA